jgi:hypothetical protein
MPSRLHVALSVLCRTRIHRHRGKCRGGHAWGPASTCRAAQLCLKDMCRAHGLPLRTPPWLPPGCIPLLVTTVRPGPWAARIRSLTSDADLELTVDQAARTDGSSSGLNSSIKSTLTYGRNVWPRRSDVSAADPVYINAATAQATPSGQPHSARWQTQRYLSSRFRIYET